MCFYLFVFIVEHLYPCLEKCYNWNDDYYYENILNEIQFFVKIFFNLIIN